METLGSGGRMPEADLVLNNDLSGQKQHAVFPINGSGPEVGAAHSERSTRCVYDYILMVHLLDLASREAEGPVGGVQHHLGGAFVRIEDITINHDIRILTKRQLAIVIKGNL